MHKLLKLKRLWLLVLFPLSILLITLVKHNQYIAEYIFARFIYKYSSQFISFLFSFIPISVAEILLYLIVVGLIILLILFGRKLIKSKGNRLYVLNRGIINIFCGMSVVLFAFVFFCGTNYYRMDFANIYNMDTRESGVEELKQLCLSLAERVNQAREKITSVDQNGVMKLNSLSDTSKRATKAMSRLSKEYPVLDRYYSRPKLVLLSKYMSYTDTTGIFIPFTMEANVNMDISDYNIPVTMCHELAHLAGFMKEDEANYIAYLACTNSEYPEFEYSGLMLAFLYSANALYREDTEAWTTVYESLSEEVIQDMQANRAYWSKLESSKVGSVVASVSTSINNSYLNLNGQEDGVKSYGEMVDLLLSEYLHN